MNIADTGDLFGSALANWTSNAGPIFLTYCCLTQSDSSNSVTRFLEYIYKFPVRIKNMFVPTMREDVISKFRETLGEK